MEQKFCITFALLFLFYLFNSSVFAQPQIELTNRGQIADSYAFGDTVLLEWTTSDSLLPVTLDYSTDGGKRWRKIATVTGRQFYYWAVPSIASQRYRLRLSISDTSFNWRLVDTLSKGGYGVAGAHFIDDTTLVTLSGPGNVDDSLRVWEMKTSQAIMAVPVIDNRETQSNPVTSLVAVSSYSRSIMSGFFNIDGCTLRSLNDDTALGFIPGSMLPMTSKRIFDDKFRPDRESVLTLMLHRPSEWMISEYKYNPLDNILNLASWFPEKSVDFVSFLPSGHILAGYKKTLNAKNKCYMYDSYTGKLLYETFKDMTALDLWYSEDGDRIAIPSKDGGTFILGSSDLDIIRQIQTHSGLIYRSAFSLDGKYLVILSGDAKLYDVDISRTVVMPVLPSRVSEVAFSPDSRLAILGYQNGDIAGFDVVTGDLVWHAQGSHSGTVSDIVFSPNREYAVTTSSDGAVYVWRTSIATDYTYTDITIQAPVIRTIPIIFGNVSSGEPEQITTTALYNKSAIDLKVQSHILHGPASAEFELVNGVPPFILKARDSHQITVRFTPQSSSYRRAWIEFSVQDRYAPTIVDLYGNWQTTSIQEPDQPVEAFNQQIAVAVQSDRDLSLFYPADKPASIILGLYDMLGRQVFESNIKVSARSWHPIQLDQPIAPGLYLLFLKSELIVVSVPVFYNGI